MSYSTRTREHKRDPRRSSPFYKKQRAKVPPPKGAEIQKKNKIG